MAFNGKNFIFDSIPSENYGIVITSTGETSQEPLADIQPTTTRIYRRNKSFLYGVTPNPTLEFQIMFHSIDGYIDSVMFGLISQWLFGQQNYKKLQILQEDMSDVYFNCFLTKPEVIKYGNQIAGVKAVVVCDSPFAYTFDRTSTYTYVSPPSDTVLTFDNLSHDSYYLFPIVEFTMGASGGNLSILSTEESRTFSFTGLAANEVITVNNDLQIITSSLALLRLSKFNKTFMRFVPGRNILRVTGSIVSLKFTYSFARKIGG